MSQNNDTKTPYIPPIMFYKLVGQPTPLARPRFSRTSTYDPQKEVKEDARLQLKLQHKKESIFEGPLELNISFFMPIPKSMPKKKKDQLPFTYHYITPDLSNLIKFVEDVASGILYKDDRSIAAICARKIYDVIPRTIFTLEELDGNESGDHQKT